MSIISVTGGVVDAISAKIKKSTIPIKKNISHFIKISLVVGLIVFINNTVFIEPKCRIHVYQSCTTLVQNGIFFKFFEVRLVHYGLKNLGI